MLNRNDIHFKFRLCSVDLYENTMKSPNSRRLVQNNILHENGQHSKMISNGWETILIMSSISFPGTISPVPDDLSWFWNCGMPKPKQNKQTIPSCLILSVPILFSPLGHIQQNILKHAMYSLDTAKYIHTSLVHIWHTEKYTQTGSVFIWHTARYIRTNHVLVWHTSSPFFFPPRNSIHKPFLPQVSSFSNHSVSWHDSDVPTVWLTQSHHETEYCLHHSDMIPKLWNTQVHCENG